MTGPMSEEMLTRIVRTNKQHSETLERLESLGTSGIQPYSDDNVSNPPTDAELDTAFGTPTTVGAGYVAVLDDNGGGANVYLVASDGSNWWHVALTKSV